MGMMDGFRRDRNADKEERGSRANVPELMMKGQDVLSAVGYFIGAPDAEPFLYDSHKVRTVNARGERFRDRPCGKKRCVYCTVVANKLKLPKGTTVNRASRRVAFSFYSIRKLHDVPLRRDGKTVLKDDKSPLIVASPCTASKVHACAWCTNPTEEYRQTRVEGLVRLDLPAMFVDPLATKEQELSRFCSDCWQVENGVGPCGGLVDHIRWECPCGTPWPRYDPLDLAQPQEQRCPSCSRLGRPREIVTCTNNCPGASRMGLFSGPWRLTRTATRAPSKGGVKTTVTWSFDFLGKKDPPPEAEEPVDLAAYYAPVSSRVQARALDIPDPFEEEETDDGARGNGGEDPNAGTLPDDEDPVMAGGPAGGYDDTEDYG